MDVDIIGFLYTWAVGVYHFFAGSFIFAAVKFFLFIYVSVLFIDIILLLILRGLSDDLKVTLYGSSRPLIKRSTMIKRWEGILARLESDNSSQYKVALLEADSLADEILKGIGFKGATMGEKLEGVKDGQLETKAILTESHAVRNRIVHETDFALSREDAEKWLDNYRKFFDEVELF